MSPIPFLIASCLLLGACANMPAPPPAALPVEGVVDPLPPPPPADPVIGWARVEFDADGITRADAGGYADLETMRPMTVDDPVRVASISKLVVALGVLRLVEAGTLDLDADVSDYLGWRLRNPAFPDTAITLRQLLGHRSGIRDDAGYALPLDADLADWMHQPGAWNAEHEPGIWFHYSNLNFPVVAAVMEGATGERFDRIMQREVFTPLDLDACFNWTTCSPEARARAVVLYEPDGTPIRDTQDFIAAGCPATPASDGSCDLSTYVLTRNGAAFSPQGGLRISARDLARIGQQIFADNQSETVIVGGVSPSLEEADSDFYCLYGEAQQLIGNEIEGCRDNLFAVALDPDDYNNFSHFGHSGEAYGVRSGLWMGISNVAYFATGLPEEGALPGRSAFTAVEERLAQGLPVETVGPEGASADDE